MNHANYCTHISNDFDKDILTRPLFDVNMRLFKSSPQYKQIVLNVCEYLIWWVDNPKEGYKPPHGVSGANAGIPFNIIAVRRGRGIVAMINPNIIKSYGNRIESSSNCGSLTLENPIDIYRDEFIDLEYFDSGGERIVETKVNRMQGGLTIQHEVQHNLGILITDDCNINK